MIKPRATGSTANGAGRLRSHTIRTTVFVYWEIRTPRSRPPRTGRLLLSGIRAFSRSTTTRAGPDMVKVVKAGVPSMSSTSRALVAEDSGRTARSVAGAVRRAAAGAGSSGVPMTTDGVGPEISTRSRTREPSRTTAYGAARANVR